MQVLQNHIHEFRLNLGLHHTIPNLYFLQINNRLLIIIILITHQKVFFRKGKIQNIQDGINLKFKINIMDLIKEAVIILVLIHIFHLKDHNRQILPIFKGFLYVNTHTHTHMPNSVKEINRLFAQYICYSHEHDSFFLSICLQSRLKKYHHFPCFLFIHLIFFMWICGLCVYVCFFYNDIRNIYILFTNKDHLE